MTSNGSIIPATAWSNGHSEGCPAFDVLDPEAVSWYIEQYKTQYLEKMRPYMNGFQPVIIARLSIDHLFPDNPLYNMEQEQNFINNLEEYRK